MKSIKNKSIYYYLIMTSNFLLTISIIMLVYFIYISKITKNISYVPIVLFILSYILIIFVSIQKKYYIHLFIYLLALFPLFFLIYLKIKDDIKDTNKADYRDFKDRKK